MTPKIPRPSATPLTKRGENISFLEREYSASGRREGFYNFLIGVIIAFAFIVRFINIPHNPAGFFTDEASIGSEAYSILTTGQDSVGRFLPVFFQSSGDFKNPVFIYSMVPWVGIFGLTEFAVRLTSVLYGTLGVVAIYLLAKELFKREVGILSALLLAVSPWHIHFSRVGFELISSVFWVMIAVWLFVKSTKQYQYYPYALIAFFIAFLTYTSPKLYLPPLVAGCFLIYFSQIKKYFSDSSFWITNIVVVVVAAALILPYIQNGSFFARWDQVKSENLSVATVAQSYIHHFTPAFLFEKGDSGFEGQFITRHSVPGMGELYWFQLPFIIAALYFAYKLPKLRRSFLVVMLLLLLYPVGTIFTTTAPQATRSVLGVVPFTILSAVGIWYLISCISYIVKIPDTRYYIRYASVVLGVIAVLSFINFLQLNSRYPLVSSDYYGWQYGYREAVEKTVPYRASYDDIIITHRFNYSDYLLNFYKVRYPCANCQVMSNPIRINVSRKQLFVLREEDRLESQAKYPFLKFHETDAIKLPNGKKELSIGFFTL